MLSNMLEKSLEEALFRNEKEMEMCQEYKSDLAMATRNLQTFQNRLKVDVMVPIGPHALMPGYLYHTNEVMIGKPSGIFIEATTSQAMESVLRRIKVAETRLKDLAVEAEFFRNKLEYPQQKDVFSHGTEKEIIEDYDEEKEKKWRIAHRQKVKEAKLKEREERSKQVSEGQFKEVLENLDELEMMEELQEEFDEIVVPDSMVDLSGQVAFTEKPRVSYELESYSREEELNLQHEMDEEKEEDTPKVPIKTEISPIEPNQTKERIENTKSEEAPKKKRKSLQFSEDLERVKLIHKLDRPNTLETNYDPEYTLQLRVKHSPLEFKPPPGEVSSDILSSPVDIYKKFAHCMKHWSGTPTTPEEQPKSILKKTSHVIPVNRNAKLLSAEDDRSSQIEQSPVVVEGESIFQQVVGDVLERNSAPIVVESVAGPTQNAQGTEPKRVSRFKAMRSWKCLQKTCVKIKTKVPHFTVVLFVWHFYKITFFRWW